MRRLSMESRLRAIRWIILDVDGVMTDGRIISGSNGVEFKSFHVHDGYGVFRGRSLGLKFAIISGRTSKVTVLRARRLGIADVVQGADDKVEACERLLAKRRIKMDEVCFIGDDEFDLPLLRRVGLSAAPGDAIAAVRRQVDYITKAGGGKGAVREVIDMILRAKKLL